MNNERRPIDLNWIPLEVPQSALNENVLASSCWRRGGGILVISTLVLAEYPDSSKDVGPQWHISVSRNGARLHDVCSVLGAFQMSDAEEDNHHPGIARHFWLPVLESRRVDCECKDTEETIVEPDGYTWTTPKEGSCRGCELERITGKKCSRHRRSADG